MAFTRKSRYGGIESCSNERAIPAVVESLIRDLETEEFDEPDDEHFQVAIGHGDWAVTVTVYGLMILSDMREIDSGIAPELYKRAVSRAEAIDLLTMMAKGQVEQVLAAEWVPRDQLPPYERALFRHSSDGE